MTDFFTLADYEPADFANLEPFTMADWEPPTFDWDQIFREGDSCES